MTGGGSGGVGTTGGSSGSGTGSLGGDSTGTGVSGGTGGGGSGGAGGAGTGTGGGTGGQGGGGTGTGGTGQQQGQAGAARSDSDLAREVSALRVQVERLQSEVANRGAQGTGGAGTEGTGAATGTTGTGGATGTTGTGAATGTTDATATPEGGSQESVVVASATFDGTVRSVSKNRIRVHDPESGEVYELVIDKGTRVLDDGKRITPRQLDEGSPVRASFDLLTGSEEDGHAREILVLDRKARK
jgi:hypothetical protein